MTHMESMPESAGEFSEARLTDCHCRKCDRMTVTVQTWESNCGGFTDYKYTCAWCGHHWWIEGPDA